MWEPPSRRIGGLRMRDLGSWAVMSHANRRAGAGVEGRRVGTLLEVGMVGGGKYRVSSTCPALGSSVSPKPGLRRSDATRNYQRWAQCTLSGDEQKYILGDRISP